MSKNISAVPGVIKSSGGATMLMNVGSMRNRGVELEIKSTNIQNKDWYWSTSLNFGHNKNTLLKLDGEPIITLLASRSEEHTCRDKTEGDTFVQ